MDSNNGSSEFESGDMVSTVTRVMVSQNRLYSSSEEVVALQVFSEVIEMEGKEVGTFLQSNASVMRLIVNKLLSYHNVFRMTNICVIFLSRGCKSVCGNASAKWVNKYKHKKDPN